MSAYKFFAAGCKTAAVILLLLPGLAGYSQKPDIRVFPGGYVYIFEESRKDSIFNLMIHNIGISNTDKTTTELEKIVIDFYSKGKSVQQNTFFTGDILKSSMQLYDLQQRGLLDNYDFMFHTKALLGKSRLANSGTLSPGTGLILRKLFFTTIIFPDSIKINAVTDSKAKKNFTSTTLLVKNYTSPVNFILPVNGSWYAAAGPSAHTHHRWGYMEEFAYDLVQMGADNLTYKDDYKIPANYHCYGKNVLATAEGVVEAVLNEIDDAEIYPKDLPQDEYMKLVQKRQGELINKYGMEGISGNFVVLKHEDNTYSFYCHLKKGSITAKKGDKIAQGRVIGQIGNSGNTTEPHLHFQLNETKDVLQSRSIPIRFSNLVWSESFEPEGSYIKSGDWVRTR